MGCACPHFIKKNLYYYIERNPVNVVCSKEKRRFKRIEESIFILLQFGEREGLTLIKGFANNISAGGLMFETDRPIPCVKHFILEIYQPQGESQDEIISITTLAEVKWVKQIDTADRFDGSNKFKIGMEFIKIDDKARKTIADYVQTK